MTEPMNWKQMTDETVQNLVRLVKEQTINPPGNELPAILVVKDILERAGFPTDSFKILESASNRVNLVARIKGDGTQRPLLLSGHVDVVPVERERWSRDPFGGEVVDGMVWGRGTLDMKGFLAMYLEVFLTLFRQNAPLKRDIILAAIADEEAGFEHGSKFLVEQHRDLIDADYAFTEGGALTIHFGKSRVYPIQVAEKCVCWLRLRAVGKPGHGSTPHSENAVLYLAEALEKLHRAKHLPVHLSPTFLKMVDSAGSQIHSPLGSLTRLLHSPLLISMFLNRLKGDAGNMLRAMVTNTISPTMLQAGSKVNVIPSVAEAALDCRLLPGQTPESVKKELQHIIGDQVELETVYTTSGAEFSTETPLYKLLERRTHQMDPGGLVIPMLMPGATDACQYKAAGIKVYGFTPGILPPGMTLLTMAHGHDERMPVSFIETGLPALWDVVSEFCGKG
ncbi:MAG TPA: M20/M25/M40 family metallo-hydrolase [Anaerolineales bacterium]|nr:M20/M25/M40 family metallo-hydrolase [Anaerolineales bacterium]